jgi:molecular chaperone GrpE
VEEVPSDIFTADLHNAVMHVEDESLPEGTIVAVFQKGYRKGDHIIRYAMVQVAN